jgi:hypothetical protein
MSYNPLPQPANVVAISAGSSVTEVNRFPVGIGSTGSVSLKYSNQLISYSNPLPVSLGSSSIIITGDVNVGTTVSVTSSPQNPVHNHLTEVGTSNILDVPYLPVGISTLKNVVSISNTSFYITNPVTTVAVSGIGSTVTVQGNVSVGNTVNVTVNTGIGTSITPVSQQNTFPVSMYYVGYGASTTTRVSDFSPFPTYLANIDRTSKNRLKVSSYETVFFNTFQYGPETDIWDERVSLGATSYHDPNRNAIVMQVGLTTGSEIIRQSRNVLRYIPGRQSQATFAVIIRSPIAGVRKRIGLFDEGNGFYFEDDGSGANGYSCVIRSSTTGITSETRVRRNDWNGDKLDGSGPSGITAVPDTQQLIVFDYEWYGAGQVKVGYVISGTTHYIHTFDHANILSLPWCSTPFLPIRLEQTNVAGIATTSSLMYQGSNSVISEGTPDKLGIAQNVGTAVTGKILPVAQTFYPIVSIRLKPTALKGIVLPTFFQTASLFSAGSGANATTVSLAYRFIRNVTVTGGTWRDMQDPNSFTQYNISSTGIGTDGIDLDSGFIIGGNGGTGIRLDVDTVYQIGRSGIGTISDTLTLAVAVLDIGVTGTIAYGSMTWIEQR